MTITEGHTMLLTAQDVVDEETGEVTGDLTEGGGGRDPEAVAQITDTQDRVTSNRVAVKRNLMPW